MSQIGSALPPALAKLSEQPEKPQGPHGAMGKDDFMKLLMAQLQNQDPLKPMDHQEFAAQLAQFSSLESLTNINKSIEGLHSGFGEESKLQAVGMIGKKVQAAGNEIELTKGESVTFDSRMPSDAVANKAIIYSPTGQIVRQMELSERQGKDITWDGKDGDGTPLPSGKYHFSVKGIGQNGEMREGESTMSGLVTGVEMEGKSPVLIVQTSTGKSRLEWGKVSQVSVPDAPAAPARTAPPMPVQARPQLVSREEPEANRENENVERVERDSGNDLGDDMVRAPTLADVPFEQLTQPNPMANLRQ